MNGNIFELNSTMYYYDAAKYTKFLADQNIEEPEFSAPITQSKSAYSKLCTPDHLPANFAMYIETPIKNPVSGDYEMISVLNCIGYGFDQTFQPDYKYFFENGAFKAGKEQEFKDRLDLLFEYIYACAVQKEKSLIMLTYVGGGEFAKQFPGLEPGYRKYYKEALNKQYVKNSISLSLLGFPTLPGKEIEDIKLNSSTNRSIEQLKDKRIPDLCFEADTKTINPKALYINAWDPHSVVGNGNGGDESLDGYFGRSTAMAFFSLPCINPEIKYESVQPIAI
jgi:hypothetical protein